MRLKKKKKKKKKKNLLWGKSWSNNDQAVYTFEIIVIFPSDQRVNTHNWAMR